MRGTLFRAATIAALTLGLQPVMAQQTIKIGFVSTFSGAQAAIGEDMRRSVDLAVEHLGGSIAGKKIEIVYEDDQFKPDVGKARSEKLVQQDKVNFVAGYIWSNVLLASYKTVVDEGDTILISTNAGPSQIAGELCNKNFFSTSWQNDQIVLGTFFNGGLRAYDISNPYQPKEVGIFMPPAPPGAPTGTIQMNDVFVDERQIVYAVDRHVGGLYILEMDF